MRLLLPVHARSLRLVKIDFSNPIAFENPILRHLSPFIHCGDSVSVVTLNDLN